MAPSPVPYPFESCCVCQFLRLAGPARADREEDHKMWGSSLPAVDGRSRCVIIAEGLVEAFSRLPGGQVRFVLVALYVGLFFKEYNRI